MQDGAWWRRREGGMVEAGWGPVDRVSGAALTESCRRFAERVKLSGTAAEGESLREVQATLDGFGYRTSLLSHPAFISLPGAAAVTVDGAGVRAITHSFGRAGEVTGPVAYLGEGTEAEFAGRALRGAIILVEGVASPAVAARALRAGAAGQLHISPHEHLHEMCISPVWGSPGLLTLPELPGTVACTVSQADGAALRERVRGGASVPGGAPAVVLRAEVDTGWRATPILVAEMDAGDGAGGGAGDDVGGGVGGGAGAPFILFSGHHDTWYFGVMDNGAANATAIECARVLAERRGEWRRGLRLCFWSGHSHGRYSGSAWYVDNHWDELERRCAVHVNVDSTGGVGATVLGEAAAAPELAGLAAAAIGAELGGAGLGGAGTGFAGRRNNRNSDMSFWGVGVPSMLGSLSTQPPGAGAVPTGLGWWWHTPEDMLDKVDEFNLRRDTRVFVRVLWRLLTDAVLPLDYPAHMDAMGAELRAVEESLGGRLSLRVLIEEAAAVREKAAALRDEGPGPGQRAERINRALLQVSRVLVPMDNTTGDRFGHDPALPLPPWPVLQPIRALAVAAPGMEGFAAVDAVRARNRVLHALRQAGRALDAALR